WQWAASAWPATFADPAGIRNRVAKDAEEGLHHMLTPDRVLTLVHAVQQPLVTPDPSKLAATRTSLGQTYADVTFTSPVHCKSTLKIDVSGTWTEPSDDVVNGLTHNARGSHAFELKFKPYEHENGSVTPYGQRHQFGDTRYRRVTYQLT